MLYLEWIWNNMEKYYTIEPHWAHCNELLKKNMYSFIKDATDRPNII